jgi:NAD(P)-dependent dehydrogenase (short-subunit alcohol dehydrogenase family)
MGDLSGQKAVIIGGSRGIGYATAELALRAGAEIAIAARGEANLKQALARLEIIAERAVPHATLDVRERKAVADFLEREAPFDHLILPGATVYRASLEDFDAEKARTSFDGKVWSAFLAAYDGRRHMRKGGTIVFYSGMANRRPVPGYLVGAMMDGALDALTRALAFELGREGLRVNCISPGIIETSWAERLSREDYARLFGGYAAKVPIGRHGQPEDCAKAALYLMSNTFITGQILAVDGGVESVP